MSFGSVALVTALELGAPSWVFGLVAFGLLVLLLVATLAVGKGRPHS